MHSPFIISTKKGKACNFHHLKDKRDQAERGGRKGREREGEKGRQAKEVGTDAERLRVGVEREGGEGKKKKK